jgi:signal transduction histidine kinase
MAQAIARQRGLTLVLEPGSDRDMVLGDASALKRLVWILVDNALKYSKPGGVIRVLLDHAEDGVKLAVRDDGIGISSADLPFVFDRFYRADPSRGLVEGNGLGLAIARWIAETHQARLSVTSEAGAGSCFTVAFPQVPRLERKTGATRPGPASQRPRDAGTSVPQPASPHL